MTTTTLNRRFTRAQNASLLDSLRQRVAHWVGRVAQREDRATSEAQGLRRLAMTYLEYNPRYAADLFAAADRHEMKQSSR